MFQKEVKRLYDRRASYLNKVEKKMKLKKQSETAKFVTNKNFTISRQVSKVEIDLTLDHTESCTDIKSLKAVSINSRNRNIDNVSSVNQKEELGDAVVKLTKLISLKRKPLFNKNYTFKHF